MEINQEKESKIIYRLEYPIISKNEIEDLIKKNIEEYLINKIYEKIKISS